MRTIYTASNPVEAEIVRAYLADNQIDTLIFGAMLWGAQGELPANAYPRLMLCDEADAPRAEALIKRYEHSRHAHASWQCACGENSPINFELCWACGEERPAWNHS